VSLGVAAQVAGGLGAQPATVASGGAEAGELLLEYGDPEVGLSRLQVVRRPQPGEAAADDGDIDRDAARQWRTWCWHAHLAEPVGDATVLEPLTPREVHRDSISGRGA
jgi:hypothetical protein